VVGISKGLFKVELLTPKARLLDCRAGSVVIPCADGQRGILRNHCPLLTGLHTGIMQVREIPDKKDSFYIIEGGFARFCENYLMVMAYEVTTFEGRTADAVSTMISKAKEILVAGEYMRTQMEKIDHQRSQLIVRMAEMAELIAKEA